MVRLFDMITDTGHEQVLFCQDPISGYRAIIAIHSTILGPAFGGTRLWNYASEEEALVDVLRLSHGMTYKNAAAGLACGGGKTVIIGDSRQLDRKALFRAHGRFVESLGGRYITAQDVGTTLDDLDAVHLETNHIAGLAGRLSGGVSPATARGVFRALQAAAKHRWGSDDLAGKTIAVQGCGNVGYHLIKELHAIGARLIVTDVDRERAQRVVREFGATAVEPQAIYDAQADMFAPCALGGILNDQTIPRLKAAVIVGGANNQLLEERHGRMLEKRGILYGPDYVANAGGVISGGVEIFGWSVEHMRAKVDAIYETMSAVFALAQTEGIPTFEAADCLAEQRIAEGRTRSDHTTFVHSTT